MNKTISIIRIAVLLVLGFLAMIYLFGEEQDGNTLTLLLHMVLDKSLAFALCYLTCRLYKRWSKTDPLLMACDRMCNETCETKKESEL